MQKTYLSFFSFFFLRFPQWFFSFDKNVSFLFFFIPYNTGSDKVNRTRGKYGKLSHHIRWVHGQNILLIFMCNQMHMWHKNKNIREWYFSSVNFSFCNSFYLGLIPFNNLSFTFSSFMTELHHTHSPTHEYDINIMRNDWKEFY